MCAAEEERDGVANIIQQQQQRNDELKQTHKTPMHFMEAS